MFPRCLAHSERGQGSETRRAMLRLVRKKSYKEVTRELHGLERPWAPAGLPGGWRDSGRAPRQPVDPLTSTARPRTRRPVPNRWIGSGEVAGMRKSHGGEGGENPSPESSKIMKNLFFEFYDKPVLEYSYGAPASSPAGNAYPASQTTGGP